MNTPNINSIQCIWGFKVLCEKGFLEQKYVQNKDSWAVGKNLNRFQNSALARPDGTGL